MKPTGTVYTNSCRSPHGEVFLSLSEKQKARYKKMRLLGAVMASFSITSFLFFYAPSFILDMDIIQSRLSAGTQLHAEETSQLTSISEEVKEIESESVMQAPLTQVNEFSIQIPAIDASSSVIHDVDPFNEEIYLDALKRGVAHAKDTGLPGEGRRIYLFAHSTNSPLSFSEFNAVFYQLRLLQNGDEIKIRLNGDDYMYKVSAKHIVSALDTHWLTESGQGEHVVLQTCDPPGTTLRRLLIVAEKVTS